MTWLKRFLVRSHLRLTGALAALRELQVAQRMEPARLQALHDERLRSLLLHAARHVPFYRDVLSDTGVVDGAGRVRLERFGDLPLLDKREIRSRFDDLASDDLAQRRWSLASSGGSTGRPIQVVRERGNGVELAVAALFSEWAGFLPGDRHAVLWGVSRGLPDPRASWHSWRGRLGRWVNNYLLLDSYHVTPATLRDHVRKINAWRPTTLYGYADFLYYLARFVEREGLAVHAPRSIVATATPLYPHMREKIEGALQAPVFDRYGSGETGLVSAQCALRSGQHVCVPTHHVEILRRDGSAADVGELGEIVVTPLFSLAMPLIRYRTEDLGAWMPGSCGCGRTWPMLIDLVGRAIDVFVTRDGRLISGGLFIKLVETVNLRHGDLVERFQVVQEEHDRVTVRLLLRGGAGAPLPADVVAEIRDGVVAMLGAGASASVELVEAIEVPRSGKFRYTISKVPRTADDLSDLFQV